MLDRTTCAITVRDVWAQTDSRPNALRLISHSQEFWTFKNSALRLKRLQWPDGNLCDRPRPHWDSTGTAVRPNWSRAIWSKNWSQYRRSIGVTGVTWSISCLRQMARLASIFSGRSPQYLLQLSWKAINSRNPQHDVRKTCFCISVLADGLNILSLWPRNVLCGKENKLCGSVLYLLLTKLICLNQGIGSGLGLGSGMGLGIG